MANRSFFEKYGNYSLNHGFGPKVYSAPSQMIPVWHLPIDEAISYGMCDAPGDSNIIFIVRTATSEYRSLVSVNKAAELLARLPEDLPRFNENGEAEGVRSGN